MEAAVLVVVIPGVVVAALELLAQVGTQVGARYLLWGSRLAC